MKRLSIVVLSLGLVGLLSCTSSRSRKNQENLLSGFEEGTESSQASVIEETAPASENLSETVESKAPEKSEDLISELTSAKEPVEIVKEEPKSETMDTLSSREPASVESLAPVAPLENVAPETAENTFPPAEAPIAETKEVAIEEAKPVQKASAKKVKASTKKPKEATLKEEKKEASLTPTESVWKKGEVLNRYYPLREGETAETVSEVLFGSKDKAEDLKKWNQGEWQVGRVLLYASPIDSEDTEMKSYEVDKAAMVAATAKKEEAAREVAQAQPVPVAPEATPVVEAKDKKQNKKLANPDVGDFVGRYLTFIVAGLISILAIYFMLRKFFGSKAYND